MKFKEYRMKYKKKKTIDAESRNHKQDLQTYLDVGSYRRSNSPLETQIDLQEIEWKKNAKKKLSYI